MSISGISSLNPVLTSLLGNNSSSSSSGSSSTSTGTSSSTPAPSGASNLSALAQFDVQQIQQAQGQLSAYQQFQSTLGSVQSALIGVLTAPFSAALSGISSSNNNVAYLSPSASTNFAVSVTQLAKIQQLTTNSSTTNTTSTPGFDPTSTQVYNTGTLTIQLGNVDTNSSSFTSSNSPVTVKVTDGSLQGIASAINGAKAGVNASVVTDANGNSQLQLTGGDTGAANGFQITGADSPGGQTNATLAGLNYTGADPGGANETNYSNPTAPIQQAQDAAYTVNGQQFGSPTNINVPVAPGVNLNLLTTGSTVISQPQAPTAIVNAANSLVSTLNGVFQVLQQFTSGNGPLASDPTTVQLFQNDVQLSLNSTYGTGTTELLSQLGISQQPDGTYAVNTQTLSQAYQQDQNGTQSVISGVASSLIQVVQTYSGQFGQVSNKINYLQSQVSIFEGQFQDDQSFASVATSQAQQATQAYNLLANATGGSQSPFTAEVA